jgi:hypothetical protein
MTDPLATPAPSNPAIPLCVDGDTYYLDVSLIPAGVHLDRVLKFTGNQNSTPTLESCKTLPQSVRREIVHQINRKYSGKTVYIE